MKKSVIALIICVTMLSGCSGNSHFSANGTTIKNTDESNGYDVTDGQSTAIEFTETVNGSAMEENVYGIDSVDEQYQWQLQSIYDSSDIWESSDDDNIDYCLWNCLYSVTDLDKDGYLEVIKTAVYSNGPSTVLWIYEVDGEGALTRMDSEPEDNDTEFHSVEYPDLSIVFYSQPMRFYQNSKGDYVYFVQDVISDGLSCVRRNYILMSVADNRILFDNFCAEASDNTETVETYFNAEGNEITEDEFNQLYSDYEALAEDEVSLSWFSEITMDNIIESYRVFYGI